MRWTSKSTRKLAAELTDRGKPVSPQKVGQMLFTLGYRLQAPRDGTKTRPLYSLDTTDKATAKRQLAKLVADVVAGKDPTESVPGVPSARLVRDYRDAWLTKRTALGVTTVEAERTHFCWHIDGAIGHLALRDVRPPHVRAILEEVASKSYVSGKHQPKTKRYGRGTVSKVRGLLHGLFRSAQEDGLVEHNLVVPVRAPRTREERKERVVLTDDEFAKLIACSEVDLE